MVIGGLFAVLLGLEPRSSEPESDVVAITLQNCVKNTIKVYLLKIEMCFYSGKRRKYTFPCT